MAKRKGKFLDFYNSVVGQEGYSARRVLDEINGYCHIPEGTFNQTINKNMEKNLNPLVVLAFCKTYGFDIDDIFRDEGSGKQENPSLPTQAGMDVADSELPNRFDLPNSFDGKFFGYSFNTTTDYTKQGKLDQFILDIDTNNQKITMTLRHFALNSSQRYSPREITMRGRVIHNENGKAPNGTVCLIQQNPTGAWPIVGTHSSASCGSRIISSPCSAHTFPCRKPGKSPRNAKKPTEGNYTPVGFFALLRRLWPVLRAFIHPCCSAAFLRPSTGRCPSAA